MSDQLTGGLMSPAVTWGEWVKRTLHKKSDQLQRTISTRNTGNKLSKRQVTKKNFCKDCNKVKDTAPMDYHRNLFINDEQYMQYNMMSDESDSDFDDDDLESMISGFSQSTRCPQKIGITNNLAHYPSLSTINGSFTSLHGHLVASDVDCSLMDDESSLFSCPKGLYSQKIMQHKPMYNYEEDTALKTEQKLADIISYLTSQASWSPVSTPRASRVPNCTEQTMNSMTESDVTNNSYMSPHGSTLPGSNTSYTDDNQSVLSMEDYDLPTTPHAETPKNMNKFDITDEDLNVRPALLPPSRLVPTGATFTGASGSFHQFNARHKARRGSAPDLEPLNKMVRRLNMADRVPCDGKEDTPLRLGALNNARNKAARQNRHSDSDIPVKLNNGRLNPDAKPGRSGSFDTLRKINGNGASNKILVAADIHQVPIKHQNKPVSEPSIASDSDINIYEEIKEKSCNEKKEVMNGGIMNNNHLTVKEYLIAKCSMSSFPSALETPPEGPARGWRRQMKKKMPIYQATIPEVRAPQCEYYTQMSSKSAESSVTAERVSSKSAESSVSAERVSSRRSSSSSSNQGKKLRGSRGSLSSDTTSSSSQQSIVTERPSFHASMFVDIGSCDTDCDEIHDFYSKDFVQNFGNTMKYDITRNVSRTSVDSDATHFMQGPMLNPRRVPITSAASKRERKVWKKFKSFKKQLSKIAVNNVDTQQEGSTLKTLAIV